MLPVAGCIYSNWPKPTSCSRPRKGLDASTSGLINQRSISPSAARNITVKNTSATSVCAKVPVATSKEASAKAENQLRNQNPPMRQKKKAKIQTILMQRATRIKKQNLHPMKPPNLSWDARALSPKEM